jgi:histidine ammonia-lyase
VTVTLGAEPTVEEVLAVALEGERVEIDPRAKPRVAAARRVVEDAASSGRAVYGINTGVGDLASVRIDIDEAARLQSHLIRAHATAVGTPLPSEVVRAMLFLKARTFAFGYSGVRFEVVERLVDLLNHRIHPVVPSQGSLGASGDLALLAHLALPLIGEGAVEYSGHVVPAADALADAGLTPIEPATKEGLSLVNGTEGMLALGILALRRAEHIAVAADITAAMSVEADLATDAVYAEGLIGLRKHPGAAVVAANLRALLRGSPIVASHRHSDHLVQDAYSLRCTPQVHGAYRDAMSYVRTILERELASAVDNPSVLADRDAVMSSGNFHGEALGLALDHLGLCLVGFAAISERRIARLVDPKLSNGLPAFLTTDPGRRTGFMIAHYTAASLVAESRSLCFPASSDSIPTSAGQEDHVSMGATSARKALAIAANTENVIAIEALVAAQGLDLRGMDPAPGTAAVRTAVRAVSPSLDEDRSLAPDIARVKELIVNGDLAAAAARAAADRLS